METRQESVRTNRAFGSWDLSNAESAHASVKRMLRKVTHKYGDNSCVLRRNVQALLETLRDYGEEAVKTVDKMEEISPDAPSDAEWSDESCDEDD